MLHRGPRRSARSIVALGVVLALAGIACGSKLGEADLRAYAALPAASGEVLPGGGSAAPGPGSLPDQNALEPDRSFEAPESSESVGGGPRPSGAPPSGTTRKSEIVLGSYGTQSGIVGAVTAPFVAALRAWVANLNARGGLNGHPVRLILADDGGDPGRALQIARRMFEEQRVLFFFGVHGATTQQAVTPYQEQHRIPVVGGVQHQDSDSSPMIFLPQLGATKGVRRSYLLTAAAQSNARKVGIVWARECGATCANTANEIKAYAPKLGFEVVYEAQVSFAQPDYTAEVIAGRNAGAEAMLLQVDPPSFARFQRSAGRQGWHPVFVGGGALHVASFPQYGEDVDGALAVSTLAPYGISPLMAPYREAMRRYVPGAPLGDYGAQAWAGGKLLEAIAPRLGESPSRAQVLEGLWSLRNETLGGIVPPLTFPRRSHENVNLCMVPVKVSGGRWVAPFGDSFFCATDAGIRRL